MYRLTSDILLTSPGNDTDRWHHSPLPLGVNFRWFCWTDPTIERSLVPDCYSIIFSISLLNRNTSWLDRCEYHSGWGVDNDQSETTQWWFTVNSDRPNVVDQDSVSCGQGEVNSGVSSSGRNGSLLLISSDQFRGFRHTYSFPLISCCVCSFPLISRYTPPPPGGVSM